MNNIRAHLFFLKQYGFSETILEKIYFANLDPEVAIFDWSDSSSVEIKHTFSVREKKLSLHKEDYNKLILDLLKKEKYIRKYENNKMFFKYDENILNKCMDIEQLPLFMYARGNLNLLNTNRKKIAIVGTRTPTQKYIDYGIEIIKKYINEDYIVISGLAIGIDTIAHELTLKKNGDTIAILPTNFKEIYPKENYTLAHKIAKRGLLLTSIGPKERTIKKNFLERNKYVANICDFLLVIETNFKSGTMNTIRNASKFNKKILFIEQESKEVNEYIISLGGEMIE